MNLQRALTFSLKHKKQIILIYTIFYIFLTISLIILKDTQFRFIWNNLGRNAGNLSVIFFSLAVLPGIINRLKIPSQIKPVSIILMLFRRQNGILMFLFALSHYLLMRIYPALHYQIFNFPSQIFEFMGMLAFTFSVPLFLTSNDYSQHRLAHKWSQLHKIVYVICWLIFLHIALIPKLSITTVLIGIISLLELYSLTKIYLNKRTNNSQSAN